MKEVYRLKWFGASNTIYHKCPVSKSENKELLAVHESRYNEESD